jgi:hypothetical protein
MPNLLCSTISGQRHEGLRSLLRHTCEKCGEDFRFHPMRPHCRDHSSASSRKAPVSIEARLGAVASGSGSDAVVLAVEGSEDRFVTNVLFRCTGCGASGWVGVCTHTRPHTKQSHTHTYAHTHTHTHTRLMCSSFGPYRHNAFVEYQEVWTTPQPPSAPPVRRVMQVLQGQEN